MVPALNHGTTMVILMAVQATTMVPWVVNLIVLRCHKRATSIMRPYVLVICKATSGIMVHALRGGVGIKVYILTILIVF